MWVHATTAALVGLGLYSTCIEPRRYVIRHKSISMPGPPIDHLRILHLSDFHFYKRQNRRKEFIQSLTDTPVDLIFITGDLIDNDSGINICLMALRHLKAKYGVYCVLGNHDYYHTSIRNIMEPTGPIPQNTTRKRNRTDYLIQGLHDLGIHVLINQRKQIEVEGHPITIVGIDDPYVERDNIPKAFENYKKNGPCFVLVHSPEKTGEIASYHPDAVFMGHTHGGQIRLPFVGPLITRSRAPRHLSEGLHRLNSTYFHTSRGLGVSLMTHIRFFCPPEITYFNIHFTQEDTQ